MSMEIYYEEQIAKWNELKRQKERIDVVMDKITSPFKRTNMEYTKRAGVKLYADERSIAAEIKRALKALNEVYVNYGKGHDPHGHDSFRIVDGDIYGYNRRHRYYADDVINTLTDSKKQSEIARNIKDAAARDAFAKFAAYLLANKDKLKAKDEERTREPIHRFPARDLYIRDYYSSMKKIVGVSGIQCYVSHNGGSEKLLFYDDSTITTGNTDYNDAVVGQLKSEIDALLAKREEIIKLNTVILRELHDVVDETLGAQICINAI